MKITKNPNLDITFTLLNPDFDGFENNSIKFIREEPRAEFMTDVPQANSVDYSMLSSGLTRPQYIVYYPLLAYNSYKPDNKELIVTNMTRKKKISQVVKLGAEWHFVTFV